MGLGIWRTCTRSVKHRAHLADSSSNTRTKIHRSEGVFGGASPITLVCNRSSTSLNPQTVPSIFITCPAFARFKISTHSPSTNPRQELHHTSRFVTPSPSPKPFISTVRGASLQPFFLLTSAAFSRQQQRWVPSSTSKSFRRRSSRMSCASSPECAAGKYVETTPICGRAPPLSPLSCCDTNEFERHVVGKKFSTTHTIVHTIRPHARDERRREALAPSLLYTR